MPIQGPPTVSVIAAFDSYAQLGRGVPRLVMHWREGGVRRHVEWAVGTLLDSVDFMNALDRTSMDQDLQELWKPVSKTRSTTLSPGSPGGLYRAKSDHAVDCFLLIERHFETALAAITPPKPGP